MLTAPGNKKWLTNDRVEHCLTVISSQARYFALEAQQIPWLEIYTNIFIEATLYTPVVSWDTSHRTRSSYVASLTTQCQTRPAAYEFF